MENKQELINLINNTLPEEEASVCTKLVNNLVHSLSEFRNSQTNIKDLITSLQKQIEIIPQFTQKLFDDTKISNKLTQPRQEKEKENSYKKITDYLNILLSMLIKAMENKSLVLQSGDQKQSMQLNSLLTQFKQIISQTKAKIPRAMPKWIQPKIINARLSDGIINNLKDKYPYSQQGSNISFQLEHNLKMTLNRNNNTVSLNQFDEQSVKKTLAALKKNGIETLNLTKSNLTEEDKATVNTIAQSQGMAVNGYKTPKPK